MTKLEIETENFRKAFFKFQSTSRKSIADNLKQQGKLLLIDLVHRTPPFDFAGKLSGKAAQKRGENAIAGDQFGGRTVNVGGFRAKTRGFFIVSDAILDAPISNAKKKRSGNWWDSDMDKIVSMFTDKKGRVYGVEKQLYRPNATVAEMVAHRNRYRSKATGQMSKAGLRTRNVGRRVFIDRMVVKKSAADKFLKFLYKQVGYMAAGWAKAATQLGGAGKIPAWIKRHDAPGHGAVEIRGDDVQLVISNKNVYPALQGIVERRAVSALKNRVWAMTNRTEHYLKKDAKDSGFAVGGS
jgi:hypothetical protein